MQSKMETNVKICGVCGDKALGCNFNAITCESCKAFFRRNALTQKELKCPFNNRCEITTVTRRFCQKCRLDKCFAIGMRKDLIMSEEDKVAKRQKIEENRAKRRYSNGFKSGFKKIKKESVEADSQDSECGSSIYNTDSDSKDTNFSEHSCQTKVSAVSVTLDSNSINSSRLLNESITSSNERLVSSSDDISVSNPIIPSTESNQIFSEQGTNCVLNGLMNNNEFGCNTTSPSFNGYSDAQKTNNRTSTETFAHDVVNNVQRLHSIERSLNNSIESILCEAIKLEYEAFSSIARFNSNSRELNEAERAKLNELIVAHKALLTPYDDELNGLNDLIGDEYKFKNTQEVNEADPVLVGVINLTATCIRRLIKMAKKINAFKNMCQEDQVALLKGGCTEIMLLMSAMNYDSKKHTWQIPHTMEVLNINVEVLKLAKGNMYQFHEHFIKTFDPKWRSDENIILILCAVVLFTPERQRVIHQDVIKLEQNSYYYLLKRYLESIYPGCEAKSAFLKLIQKIAELHKVNEELINVLLNVNPSQVEPLLIEIFDLKPK